MKHFKTDREDLDDGNTPMTKLAQLKVLLGFLTSTLSGFNERRLLKVDVSFR